MIYLPISMESGKRTIYRHELNKGIGSNSDNFTEYDDRQLNKGEGYNG